MVHGSSQHSHFARNHRRPFSGALDADSASADALAEVARLESLRDRLGEHGAAVDGRQPERKLKEKSPLKTNSVMHSRDIK